MMLLTELDEATRSPEQFRELVAEAAEGMHPSAALALQEAVRDAVKLSHRVGSLHRLADTLAKLQALERKAFGMDDKDDKTPNAYEDGLRELAVLGGTA